MRDVLRFFHPVLASRALRRDPVRVTVDGRDFVLFRDGAGRAAALVDRCPHRFAPLSKGRVAPDGRLTCPYHGWSFDADGHGRSPSQPTLSKCDAQPLVVREAHDTIWIRRAEPGHAPPLGLPSLGVPEGFEWAGRFDMLFEAPLHVALDNFSEDEHTPWVHTRLGWTAKDVETIDFTADNFDDRTEVRYTARQRYSRVNRAVGIHRGDLFHNDWVTYFDPVRTLYSIYWTDPATGARRPGSMHAAIFMVPEKAGTTRFQILLFTRHTGLLGYAAPLLKPLTMGLVWLEIRDDAKFVPILADTPEDLRGMRLGKFDKPIIHNRKLMRRIYRGETPLSAEERPDGEDRESRAADEATEAADAS
jgi:phenylpropionate dioxygenase-like ring-hydroxylating dioxygenase large terminal subunit